VSRQDHLVLVDQMGPTDQAVLEVPVIQMNLKGPEILQDRSVLMVLELR